MTFPKYQSYRNSGVEWLGSIPSHWNTKKLKFIAKQVSDKIEMKEQPGNYLGLENIESWTGKLLETELIVEGLANRFKKDEILFGKLRPYLAKVHLAEQEGCCTTEALVLRFPNSHPSYCFYLLLSQKFIELVNSSVYGSKMPRASWDFIGSQYLPLPTFEEQKRIAEFLDRKTAEIDQAIAQKQRLIELLKEQKAILIDRAVIKGLNPNTPMHDSGVEWIGEIPEHWTVTRLKRLFLEIDNRSTDGSETLFSLRMYEGLVPHDDVSDKPIEDAALVGYKRVCPGQIVMNRMRAAIGLFGAATNFGLVSPDYAIFHPIKNLRMEYYLNLFKTESLKKVFFLESKGLGTGSSGFLRLYSDEFGMIKVPFPPLEEQTEICNYIQNVHAAFSEALTKVEKEISLLKELKQTFISQAVTGKIKV